MPSLPVLSVDTTANTLTSTGVAASGGAEGSVLQTGDRLRLRNTGGALPAATPSLAGATDYWARRVSDDAIQIYDTNAHSLAGGSTGLVDITGAGSGTTTIEFGLPYCLPTAIAGPGVQARSSIFNAMYSSLVALYDLLTGQAQSQYSGVTLAGLLTANAGMAVGANQHVTVSGTGEYKHGARTQSFTGTDFIVQAGTAVYNLIGDIVSTSSCILIARIPLHVGDRITSITATFDSATGTVDVTDFSVDRITANGTATSLGATTVSNIGAPTTTPIDLTDTTLAANESLIVSISINATGCSVRNLNVTYTHP